MEFGASIFFTDYSIPPAELAVAMEERGFDSLWAAEHSHIPVPRRTPAPGGGELAKRYYDVMDPFVTLTAAAAASKCLKLATGICLVIQRDTIQTAKLTHDYKRHGTTTLLAALSVLDGTVIGRCMQRHRHSQFIRFLNAVEREVPAGKLIHTVLDNYATHKHPKSLPSRRRGCWPGWRAIRAGLSTSPRPRP